MPTPKDAPYKLKQREPRRVGVYACAMRTCKSRLFPKGITLRTLKIANPGGISRLVVVCEDCYKTYKKMEKMKWNIQERYL